MEVPPRPVPVGSPGLEHEVGDYAVEEEGIVVAATGEGFEVFAGLEGLG